MSESDSDVSDDEFFDVAELIDQAAQPDEVQVAAEERFMREAAELALQQPDQGKGKALSNNERLMIQGRLAKMNNTGPPPLPAKPALPAKPKPAAGAAAAKAAVAAKAAPAVVQGLKEAPSRDLETLRASTAPLMQLPDTMVYMISHRAKSPLSQGTMELRVRSHESRAEESYLLLLSHFKCTLDPLDKLVCLQVDGRHFVLSTTTPELFYGFTLGDTVPAADVELLEAILKDNTTFRVAQLNASGEVLTSTEVAPMSQQDAKIASYGQKLSRGAESGGQLLVKGITKGTGLLGRGIRGASSKLKQKLRPCDKPVELKDTTKSRISKAKAASVTARQTSKKVIGGLEAAASTAGSAAAGAAARTKAGQRVKAKLDARRARKQGKPSKHQHKVDAAKAVGRSAALAARDVIIALDDAAETLIKELTDNTAGVVGHKYGEQMGQATHDSLSIAADVYVATSAARGVKHFGAKKALKVAAKAGAKDMLDHMDLAPPALDKDKASDTVTVKEAAEEGAGSTTEVTLKLEQAKLD